MSRSHWSHQLMTRRAKFEPKRGEILIGSALMPRRRREMWPPMILGGGLGFVLALLVLLFLNGCGEPDTNVYRAYCNAQLERCQAYLEVLCRDSDEFCDREENVNRRGRYLLNCSTEYDACWEVAVTIPEVRR